MSEPVAPTALLPPGTTLGLFCGGVALVTCGAPWLCLAVGALGLVNLWRARRAVRRQPTVYRESGLRIITRLLIMTAWAITALVVLAGSSAVQVPLPASDLW